MTELYTALARRGKNDWWRYLLAFFLILAGWLGFSLLLYALLIVFVVFDGDPATGINTTTGMATGAPLLTFVALVAGFAGLVLSLYIVVRFIHRRPFLTLITPRSKIDWRRIGIGFAVFLALATVASIVEAVLYPGRYQFSFNLTEFLKFIPFVLILLPVQTTGEELLFRGYLMQSIGLLTRRPLIAALISSFVFMLLHLANPEVGGGFVLMAAVYFITGLFFSLITLRDNRLELAIGAHAANNLFAALFANYANSPLATPSVFSASQLDATYSLVSFIVIAAVFYAVFFLRGRGRAAAGDAAARA
jgi:uncharacterized protein